MSVLKGTTSLYDYEASDQLAHNLKQRLAYGLLELGAYTNVKFSLPTSGYSNLKKVYDGSNSTLGRIYEGMGPSWIWESGVSPIDNSLEVPIQVSGVYVDNVFYPISTSGTHAFTVDYERGRIIFDNIVSGNVQCEYTFRDVDVYLNDAPQWKTIITEYTNKFNDLDILAPSGMASILKENRVWLPAVVIEVEDRSDRGLQLGGGEISEYAVFYHIFADRPFINKRLADTINNQFETTIPLYDINSAPFPLNYNGSIASGALTYTQLASSDGPYFWTYAHINSSKGGPRDNITDVYRAEIIQNIEVERYIKTY